MSALKTRCLAVALSCLAQASFADLARSPFPIFKPDLNQSSRAVETNVEQGSIRFVSLVPIKRPSNLKVRRTRTATKRVSYAAKGSVCGVKSIRGQAIASIPARLKGCGLKNPVKITEVSGIRLSMPATLDCTTAKALKTWIDKGAIPAIGRRGGGLAALNVVGSYSCRTRNNQPGAKVSEHGSGRAIDIAGMRLKDGERITLLKGWNTSRNGAILRKMHRAACGPFGTVLGPDANRFHLDHFHFDTARHRSGSYCR